MTFSLTRGRPQRSAAGRFAVPLILPILALILSLFTGLSGVLRRQLETAAADQAETLLSEAAATALDAAFSERNDLSSGIVTVSRADDGTITSVTSAPGALSALSAAFQTKLREALAARGKNPDVYVTFSRESYPTRTYGDLTLPAGEYDSLRVVIGAGEGKNWWCVLFPPLCTAASCEGVPLGLSESEYRLLTEGKKTIRFKSLELISLLFSK